MTLHVNPVAVCWCGGVTVQESVVSDVSNKCLYDRTRISTAMQEINARGGKELPEMTGLESYVWGRKNGTCLSRSTLEMKVLFFFFIYAVNTIAARLWLLP